MDVYDRLNVPRIINGNATLTVLGGSIIPPEVAAAMADAGRYFVDMDELQEKAGQRLAQLTRNEAAYVSNGAAAGLTLAAAACMAGTDPDKREQLPNTTGMKNQVIVHKAGRVQYDFAIRQAGAKLVEIGEDHGTSPDDLKRAINADTAAIFYFHIPTRMDVQLPMQQAVDIARQHDLPLIVDAAAQLPPMENLWRFTEMGADLALFSGGKGLCGPQASGLVLGRKDLIRACAFHASPRPFLGRPMKVGKEEIVGLLAAVERYVQLDHDQIMQDYEDQVQYVIDACSAPPRLTARRDFPSEAGQPMPRAEVILDPDHVDLSRDDVLNQLRRGDPAISLAPAGPRSIYVNPQSLEPGEARIIVDRIKQIVGA